MQYTHTHTHPTRQKGRCLCCGEGSKVVQHFPHGDPTNHSNHVFIFSLPHSQTTHRLLSPVSCPRSIDINSSSWAPSAAAAQPRRSALLHYQITGLTSQLHVTSLRGRGGQGQFFSLTVKCIADAILLAGCVSWKYIVSGASAYSAIAYWPVYYCKYRRSRNSPSAPLHSTYQQLSEVDE